VSGPSILIVEDDPGSADAFVPMLTSRGYDVRVATDAHEALLEIDKRAPAAMLVDLHLPGVDGVTFIRRLHDGVRHAGVPVALVTADYLLDDRVSTEIDALGAPLYYKPLWEEDLVEIVERLLGGSEKFRAPAEKSPSTPRVSDERPPI